MNSVIKTPIPAPTNEISPEAFAVKAALRKHGLETPLIETSLDRDEKYHRIKNAFYFTNKKKNLFSKF